MISLSRTFLAEGAYEAILERILSGSLASGTVVSEVSLAKSLNVSRTPVHQALTRLAKEGRIEHRSGLKPKVARFGREDLIEIYEMRLLLEVHCVRLAVRNVTDEGVARLMEMSRRMHVEHEGEPGRIARRDFYAELYGWSDRPKMREVILRLRDDVHRYHVLSSEYDSHGAHRELLDLIAARDADGAARAIRRHLRAAREDLVGSLRREERLRDSAARKARRRR